MTKWKSKIGVVSGVINSTESESEESERFHFLPIPLVTPSLMIQWKLDCRSRKQKRKNKPITVLVLRSCEYNSTNNMALIRQTTLAYSSASASDSDSFHEIVGDGVISGISVLLPTPSVWFSRDRIALGFWLRFRLRLRRQWKPAFRKQTGAF